MADNETLNEKVSSGLFDRITDFFQNTWVDLALTLATPTAGGAITIINYLFGEDLADDIMFLPNSWYNILGDGKIPEGLNKALVHAHDNPSFMNQFWIAILNVIYFGSYLFATIPAIYGRETLEANKEYCPSPIDMSTLGALFYRHPDNRDNITDKAQENGFSLDDVTDIFDSMSSLLSVDDLRRLKNRGVIEDDVVNDELGSLGFTEDKVNLIKELFNLLPPVQDMVTMAVREAFTPAIVDKYGLHESMPADFISNAQLLGLNKDWAKAYWAAHWELPSLTAGFEMFHRGVIDEDNLNTLLQTKDIMPFWKDKLTKIAYNNYTRVDVRRMHQLGILNESDVYQSYLDLGYNDKKASNMTEFTLKYNAQTHTSDTKDNILNSYHTGVLTSLETNNYLQALGYDDKTSNYYLAKVDYDKSLSIKNKSISSIGKQYIKGIINDGQTHSMLGKLNLSSGQVMSLMSTWDIDRLAKDKSFPIGSLKRLFQKRHISETEFRAELSKSGYSNKYVGWIILLEKDKM